MPQFRTATFTAHKRLYNYFTLAIQLLCHQNSCQRQNHEDRVLSAVLPSATELVSLREFLKLKLHSLDHEIQETFNKITERDASKYGNTSVFHYI